MASEKKAQAKELYFQSTLNKTQIADTVGVPRRTLHFWIKKDNWDRLKNSAEHLPAIMVENVYHILGNYTRSMLSADNYDQSLTRDQAEILYKLTNTLKKLKDRSSLNDSMEMFALFQDGLRRENPDLAGALKPYIERYMSKRSRIYQHHLIPADFNSDCRMKLKGSNEEENRLDYFDMNLWQSEDGVVPPQWGPDPAATEKDLKSVVPGDDGCEAGAPAGSSPADNPPVAAKKSGKQPVGHSPKHAPAGGEPAEPMSSAIGNE